MVNPAARCPSRMSEYSRHGLRKVNQNSIVSLSKKCNKKPLLIRSFFGVTAMDIDLLKTFIEVNRTRHFSRAAENLYVTSAAVSARIKLLEKQLGIEVFVRNRGNIQLTGEGERLLPYAETMINTWAQTLQDLRLQPELDGRIHIGATSNLWTLSLEEKLLELCGNFPGLAIHAEGHTSIGLSRRLSNRTLDMVLVHDPPVSSEFHSEKVGEIKLILATNQKTSEFNNTVTDGYIYVDWGTAFSGFHARKFGEDSPAKLHVNLASIALGVLAARPGSAYLPASTVASTDGLQAVVGAPVFKRAIYLSYRDSNENIEIIKELSAQIKGLSM